MSNIVLKNKEISRNLIKNSERKGELLFALEVQQGLSDIEYKIADASIIGDGSEIQRKPIKSLEDSELKQKIKQTLKFIVRDLGLKNWVGDDAIYEALRFMEVLKDYYSELSYKEVELSFELLSVGKLDEFLPKGSGNKVEKGHYQSFSVEFICRVLNAFKECRNRVWSKANKLLPEAEIITTEEQRMETEVYFRDDLIRKFTKYKESGVIPVFTSVSIYYNKLKEKGFVNEEIEINQEDRNACFVEIMCSNFKNEFTKRNITKDHNELKSNKTLDLGSERKCMERMILRAFDEMIELGIDLKQELESEE